MATESSSVIVNLQVNLKGQLKLDKLNDALMQTKKNLQGLQRSTKSNQVLQNMGKQAGFAALGIKALQNAQSRAIGTVTNLGKSYQGNANSLGRLSNSEKAAAREAMAWLKIQQRNIAMSKTLAGRLSLVETRFDALFRAGFRLQMVGSDLMNFGKKVLSTFVDISRQFGDFQFMVNRAAGAMGILTNQTDRGVNVYDALQGEILNAAKALRLFDPAEVAKATYYWASTSGQQVKTLADMRSALEAVVPIMKAAALTETDYETTIKGVYSILVQYNKGIGDVADVTQKLFTVTQLTAAEFPDLINSFKMVGPIAAANNVTFDDMVNIFGRLADAGIRGSMAGRAFRQLFIQLVRPSDKARTALENLWRTTAQFGGKSYAEMVFPQGSFVGPAKYIEMLATATKNLTQAQRNQFLATVTTANELPVITALVNQQITAVEKQGGAWKSSQAQLKNAADYFNRAWGLLANSWNGVVGALQRGVDVIRIQIGRRLAETFTPVINNIVASLNKVSDWIDDPRNAQIIDWTLKLAGGIAALAIAAGGLATLTGALISAGSALAVAVAGFGPLVAQATVFMGVIAGLGSAVRDNFNYIKSAILSAMKDVQSAFGDGTSAGNSFKDIVGQIGKATKPVFSFIVRTVADLIRSFGSLIKILAGFGPSAFILQTLAQAMILLFSAKMIAQVTGLATIFKKLNFILRDTVVTTRDVNTGLLVTSTNVGLITKASNGLTRLRTGGLSVAGAFRTLRGAAAGLVGFLGPAGTLFVGMAALSLAYENFPSFRQRVDDLTAAFKDHNKALQETVDLLGDYNVELTKGAMNDPQFAARSRELEELNYLLRNQPMFVADPQEARRWDEMIKRRNELADWVNSYKKDWINLVNALNYQGISIDQNDFFERAIQGTKEWRVNTDEAARAIYQAYMVIGHGGSVSLKEAEGAWNNLTEAQKKAIPKTSFLDVFFGGSDARIQKQFDQKIEDLINAYDSSIVRRVADPVRQKQLATAFQTSLQELLPNASPEMQEKVRKLVHDTFTMGGVSGLDDAGDDPDIDAAAARTVEDWVKKITDSAAGLKSIPDKISAAMKAAMKAKPADISAILKSYFGGTIGKGFKLPSGIFVPAAAAAATAWDETFAAQVAGMKAGSTPASFAKWAKNVAAQFTKALKTPISAAATDESRQDMENAITTIYAAMGKPVPQWILNNIWKNSKNAGEHIPQGTASGVNAQKPKVDTAVGNMRRSVQRNLDLGGAPYTWGQHLANNFINGFNSKQERAEKAAAAMAAKFGKYLRLSRAKYGPLVGSHLWGYHLGENIIEGMEKIIPDVARTAEMMARAARVSMESINPELNSGANIVTTGQRTIKIELEVTSPDGSVDRVKAAQIEQSLSNSDLVLSLEHMVTVG